MNLQVKCRLWTFFAVSLSSQQASDVWKGSWGLEGRHYRLVYTVTSRLALSIQEKDSLQRTSILLHNCYSKVTHKRPNRLTYNTFHSILWFICIFTNVNCSHFLNRFLSFVKHFRISCDLWWFLIPSEINDLGLLNYHFSRGFIESGFTKAIQI